MKNKKWCDSLKEGKQLDCCKHTSKDWKKSVSFNKKKFNNL